jgi:thioredoxin 1
MRKSLRVSIFLAVAMTIVGEFGLAQTSPNPPASFPALDQWKSAVIAGDASALKAFYSSNPPASIQANGVDANADSDVNFWLGLKAKDINLQIVRFKERANGDKSIIFKAQVQKASGEIVDVTDAQGWRKQGDQWHVMAAERTDAPHLQQPSDMSKNIYPDDADAHAEIAEAEQQAAGQHKRILLIFGANWCYDCHVLDLALHRSDFASVMTGYEVVHVDLGPDEKKNGDVVKQFDVTLDKGVPVLAVINSDGKVVVSQKNGEFEDARSLTPEVLLAFLNKWKPEAR